jgi:hypothetical protein
MDCCDLLDTAPKDGKAAPDGEIPRQPSRRDGFASRLTNSRKKNSVSITSRDDPGTSIAAFQQQSGKRRINGPPPQPILPGVRHAILSRHTLAADHTSAIGSTGIPAPATIAKTTELASPVDRLGRVCGNGLSTKTRHQKRPPETGDRNDASMAEFRTRRPLHIRETSRCRAVIEGPSYVTRWRRTGWLGRVDSNLCISESDFAKALSLSGGIRTSAYRYHLIADLDRQLVAPQAFSGSTVSFEMRSFESRRPSPPVRSLWAASLALSDQQPRQIGEMSVGGASYSSGVVRMTPS